MTCVRYGVELLVKQLLDESLTVASTALDILDEVSLSKKDSIFAVLKINIDHTSYTSYNVT